MRALKKCRRQPRASRSPMTRPRENRPVSGHTPLMSLNLNEMDRGLSREEREEWNEIYASYRSKSLISGRIMVWTAIPSTSATRKPARWSAGECTVRW